MGRSEARRRGSGHSGLLSPKPLYRPQSDPPLYAHSIQNHQPTIPIASPSVTTPPHSAPPRTLVWRDHDQYNRGPPDSGMMPYSPGPSHLGGPPIAGSGSGSGSASYRHPSPYPHPHPNDRYSQPNGHRHGSPSRPYHMDDGLTPNLWHPAPPVRFGGKFSAIRHLLGE
jgi:hypothetical protein